MIQIKRREKQRLQYTCDKFVIAREWRRASKDADLVSRETHMEVHAKRKESVKSNCEIPVEMPEMPWISGNFWLGAHTGARLGVPRFAPLSAETDEQQIISLLRLDWKRHFSRRFIFMTSVPQWFSPNFSNDHNVRFFTKISFKFASLWCGWCQHENPLNAIEESAFWTEFAESSKVQVLIL